MQKMHTTSLWNNLHHIRSNPKDWKVLWGRELNGLNKIAKFGYGHLCLRGENHSFDSWTNEGDKMFSMQLYMTFIRLVKVTFKRTYLSPNKFIVQYIVQSCRLTSIIFIYSHKSNYTVYSIYLSLCY